MKKINRNIKDLTLEDIDDIFIEGIRESESQEDLDFFMERMKLISDRLKDGGLEQ